MDRGQLNFLADVVRRRLRCRLGGGAALPPRRINPAHGPGTTELPRGRSEASLAMPTWRRAALPPRRITQFFVRLDRDEEGRSSEAVTPLGASTIRPMRSLTLARAAGAGLLLAVIALSV